MRLLGWLRRVVPELEAMGEPDDTQRDPRLDDLTRERVRANVMAELSCKCPCHARHDADLALEIERAAEVVR